MNYNNNSYVICNNFLNYYFNLGNSIFKKIYHLIKSINFLLCYLISNSFIIVKIVYLNIYAYMNILYALYVYI